MGLDLYFHRAKTKEIGYFRKVNFLIPFFENQLGCEIENLRKVKIDKDAEELLKRCSAVLDDHSRAKELLPTQEGFFFGSTDYDDYYFEDVESVRDYVKDTLLPEFDVYMRNGMAVNIPTKDWLEGWNSNKEIAETITTDRMICIGGSNMD